MKITTRLIDLLMHVKANEPVGAGDWLHIGITKWFHVEPSVSCGGCKAWIDKLNAWTIAEAREHASEVVDHLMEQAAKRDWWRMTAYIPGSRAVVEALVEWAITKAEGQANSIVVGQHPVDAV